MLKTILIAAAAAAAIAVILIGPQTLWAVALGYSHKARLKYAIAQR